MSLISLGNNIASLQTQTRLGEADSRVSKIFQRLSSGLRINHASDDAAGLSIATDLSVQSRVYGQAIRNVNDGVSILSIADSAVAELANIVTRIRELAEQSANATYSNKQRLPLDAEAQALRAEYFRIARTATFNGINLFDGQLGSGLSIQAGYGASGSIQSSLGGNLGTGSFASPVSMSTAGTAAYDTISGDFNNDGVSDIVSLSDNGGNAYVQLRLGNGDGSFKNSATVILPLALTFSSAVKTGDINNDGNLDLVFGQTDVFGQVITMVGNGNGTFKAPMSIDVDCGLQGLALADLNNDGFTDIVSVGDDSGSGSVSILLGNGSGNFKQLFSYSTPSFNGHDVSLSDLNNDGIVDMVVGGNFSGESTIVTRFGRGDGTFGAAASYSMTLNLLTSLEYTDLNGDNIEDLVSIDTDTISVRLGNSNGTFRALLQSPTIASNALESTAADFNGDGFIDLALSNDNGANGNIVLLLGRGNGTFTSGASFAGGANGIFADDFDGDGVLDLTTAGATSGSADVSFIRGLATGGISPLLSFSLQTRIDSLQSLGMLDRSLKNISKHRGIIGSFESRLTSAASNLQTTRENYLTAASQIKDTDVAIDSAELVRTQILQQGAAAVLGQANSQPQIVLQLLNNI